MSTRKKNSSSVVKESSRKSHSKAFESAIGMLPFATVQQLYGRLHGRINNFLIRRPHRSFRRTRRRDYVRTLELPGYWAFTNSVRRTLWQNKNLFILLALTYAVMSGLLVGLASQSTYEQLSDTLRETSGEIFDGNWGQIGQASLLLTTALTGSLNGNITDAQSIYTGIVILLTWLTTVWCLRAILASKKPRLRDGLYNASAPILSTFLVSLLLVVQLLPIAIAVIAFSSALSSGLLDGGAEAMIFWTAAILLGVLSLYWITSTVIALVVVTLPGMYPMQAIRTAGDLVIGRRMRILLRFLWLGLSVVILWAFTMVPIILFDAWIKGVLTGIQWVPLVPVALLAVSSVTTVWTASYVYLFYRKVVDDDAAPA